MLMGEKEALSDVRKLQHDAEELLAVVRAQARRGYLVEISGTPKAGKSSTISMVEGFFRACGWRVGVLRETAALCPLPMKGHFFFNTWTTTQMLAAVLEAVERPLDLVIVDRGLFDALVWLELQKVRGQVASDEANAFSAFVLLDRWRTLIDTSLVMKVSPKVAMEREQHDRLVPRIGSVMNEQTLSLFNATLATCLTTYSTAFNFYEVDVDLVNRKEAACLVARALLGRIHASVDPDIAGVPKTLLNRLLGESKTPCLSWSLWDEVAGAIELRRRSEAERDTEWVQLMSCGIVSFDNGVFVFDRSDSEKVHRYGRSTIWRSRHVEACSIEQARQATWLADGLSQRLAETLYVKVGFAQPRPLGLVWDPALEPQHLAVAFRIPIESRSVADSLEQKEFRTNGRRHQLLSRFVSLSELTKLPAAELEGWSRAIVEAGWLR